EFELTVYGMDKVNYVFKSSITGKAIERATLKELEAILQYEYPDIDLEDAVLESEHDVDRFQVYRMLLIPLEKVEQGRKYHPEGDALYHSLQVFELARDELPYDEEFLLAALLHDVGKAIDPKDHVHAGLEALEDFITDRTAWLIGNHMEAHKLLDGTIGARAKRRLQSSPDYDELFLLAQCDRDGRVPGGEAPDLDEALEYLRDLVRMCG
ncbi:MAG: HD domain-containing protein, partial [Planctomycetota bacterium]